ncbi:MAG: DNA recombination protein RmuC [Clostridia bacterium]|nr:DNA recombination protein RmuC [Clostridia bacterium]
MDTVIIILCAVAAAAAIITAIISLMALSSVKKEIEEIKDETNETKKEISSIKSDALSAVNDGIKTNGEILQSSLRLYGEQVSTLSASLDTRMESLRKNQDERLEAVRATLDRNVRQMQEDNQKKLEEIRTTVDEKLQKTLNERVTESFKLVGTQLEQVHKSLGEMQTLASGVGDLKKILSNVKTRGVFGEVQLSRILEQILTTDQYVTNFATKKNSRDVVEFAVKLPGKSEYDEPVYLPLDAKFPLDVYNALLDAYDSGDPAQVESTGKIFELAIKKNAKDIHDKYIDPPNTTDFAVMFLPTEGLYAEVVRRTGLIEALATDFSVNVCGPSTISAFLNSLQMGFRTLAIEKRSHEVWNILGAVKTEFGHFDKVLTSVKKKFASADNDLNDLIGVRTRVMMRKLKSVETLSDESAKAILGSEFEDSEGDE